MSSIEGIEDPFGPGTAGGTRILYISPLKALGADVERNLRAPLTGITRLSGNNTGEPNISVGVRSGDTPARERRQLISNPPDILITTPESLYLMLTSAARNTLAGAYQAAGRLTEAITLHEQVLTDSIRILGEDHPDTLASRNNLAGAYHAAGRLTEAITLYEQVLTDSIRVLGEAHPFTATVRENLEAAKRELERQEDDSAAE